MTAANRCFHQWGSPPPRSAVIGVLCPLLHRSQAHCPAYCTSQTFTYTRPAGSQESYNHVKAQIVCLSHSLGSEGPDHVDTMTCSFTSIGWNSIFRTRLSLVMAARHPRKRPGVPRSHHSLHSTYTMGASCGRVAACLRRRGQLAIALLRLSSFHFTPSTPKCTLRRDR